MRQDRAATGRQIYRTTEKIAAIKVPAVFPFSQPHVVASATKARVAEFPMSYLRERD
ncbi:MAG TPA: hypothetical protein VFC10_05495 [Terriglobia bacterium]|nr:hypothetical protein [Terriglobia bacterium]